MKYLRGNIFPSVYITEIRIFFLGFCGLHIALHATPKTNAVNSRNRKPCVSDVTISQSAIKAINGKQQNSTDRTE